MKMILKNATLGILSVFLMGFLFISCSKKSTVAPPTPLGGYLSSDSVASGNLIAYWPFDGNANEQKSGITATAVGVTFNTGIRGQAYQGATGSYATLALPTGNAFSSLKSYSLSVWLKLAGQQPAGNPGGIFFLRGATTLNELIYEIEPYSPKSGDSIKIHHGFNDLGSPAYQLFVLESFDTAAINKWVHLVSTYDGTTSTYTLYANGVPIGVNSAFSPPAPNQYVTPTTMYTDGTKATLLGNLSFASDPPTGIVIGTWPATLFGVSPTLGANGSFLGQLDELRVYNKALSSAEVQGLYLNGKAGR